MTPAQQTLANKFRHLLVALDDGAVGYIRALMECRTQSQVRAVMSRA